MQNKYIAGDFTMKTKQNSLMHVATLPSLSNGLKCRKPVFMRIFGICFIKWL